MRIDRNSLSSIDEYSKRKRQIRNTNSMAVDTGEEAAFDINDFSSISRWNMTRNKSNSSGVGDTVSLPGKEERRSSPPPLPGFSCVGGKGTNEETDDGAGKEDMSPDLLSRSGGVLYGDTGKFSFKSFFPVFPT